MSTNTTVISTTSSTAQTSLTSTSVDAAVSSSVAAAVTSSFESTATAASTTAAAAAASSTTTLAASSTDVVTSVVLASSASVSTEYYTSVVTASSDGSSAAAITVVVTSQVTASAASTTADASSTSTSAAASSTSSSSTSLTNNGSSGSSGSGLSTGGKTAIAVVIPVVVVALLVLLGLFLWRRRKQKKTAEESRRREVEEYGFNPNHDPTLPAIGSDAPSEMTEDTGGYRGWGATTMSNRKASTTLSGGHTQGQPSDGGSGGYNGVAEGGPRGSDGNSGDLLMNPHDTMSNDDLGALGAAPAAGANRYDGMKRGPSNASSSYSIGNRSDHSDPPYGQAIGSESYQPNSNYSFVQPGPYGDGSYGGGDGMPVVRDVSARRNTQIEQGGRYAQANSGGIAQNF